MALLGPDGMEAAARPGTEVPPADASPAQTPQEGRQPNGALAVSGTPQARRDPSPGDARRGRRDGRRPASASRPSPVRSKMEWLSGRSRESAWGTKSQAGKSPARTLLLPLPAVVAREAVLVAQQNQPKQDAEAGHDDQYRKLSSVSQAEMPQKQLLVPFWFVVTGSVLMAVVLAVVGTFVPLNYFSTKLRDQTTDSCQSAVAMGNELLAGLVYNEVTSTSYVSLLHSIELNIMGFTMEPAYSAVGALGGSIATRNRFGNGWTGDRDFVERVELSRFAWAGLKPKWTDTSGTQMSGAGTQMENNLRKARTDNLFIGFASGQRVGINFISSRTDYCPEEECGGMWRCWENDAVYSGPTIETVTVTPGSLALFECRDQCQSYAGCNYWTVMTITGDCFLKSAEGNKSEQNDTISGIPNCDRDVSENIASIGYVVEGTQMTFWTVHNKTGNPETKYPWINEDENFTKDPWYMVQTQLAQQGRPLTGAWSDIWPTSGEGFIPLWSIAYTLPVAYCGDYSCMEGVVATNMPLDAVSYDAFNLWWGFKGLLSQPPYEFPIGTENSSMFIVSRVARSPAQEGLLVGCSHGCSGSPFVAAAFGEVPYADNFSNPAIVSTSKAILQRFGTWNNESLEDHQMFTFKPNSVGEIFEPGAFCDREFDQVMQGGECWQAGTISVRLDDDTAWLVVLVLPAGSFAQKPSEVASNATIQVQEVEDSSDVKVSEARHWTAVVALAVLLLSTCLGICLGLHVSSRLRELAVLTQRLSNLDFTQPSKLKSGCVITDVTNLQQAFCSLTRGIKAFARFVPEPVVRSLVHGRGIKMEVRQVTILSSDIQDFTKMSEQLGQVELLFMLTRYLSVMQRVVHMYKGVIGEILGDGLLIYWNTPDDVEQHAELACAAAVLMQDNVMELLNSEFSHAELPRIKIRIGIHTAMVSSGIVGSEMKKKFGCLGAGVDIAEHLESSCKRLQKRTLVSERTLNALPLDSGFRYEYVGVEHVEGEDEPLKIYELISRDWSPGESQAEEGETPSAKEGEEEVVDITRTMSSRAALPLSPLVQQLNSSGFPAMLSMRSRRSVSSGCESSAASGCAVLRASSRRTTLQDYQDAAQAVAESGQSLQANSALFPEGMLELIQSASTLWPRQSTHSMASIGCTATNHSEEGVSIV